MKFSIETRLGNLFTAGLMVLIGYAIYEKGRADAVHQIYEKGWHVVADDKDEK